MGLKSGISENGYFIYGIHKPSFTIKNLREDDCLMTLGKYKNGHNVRNNINFPEGDIDEDSADWIFEIPNAFPFRGSTFITKSWADEKSINPLNIKLPEDPSVSLTSAILQSGKGGNIKDLSLKSLLDVLPEPLLLALATTSTDQNDLVHLAKVSCDFIFDRKTKRPVGLSYRQSKSGDPVPIINNPALFEALANNYHLPNEYKEIMVLRPGVQGSSEIVGEWTDEKHQSHIFEYLRRNSYIPWGHFAANMAHDSIRYRLDALSTTDMLGLRHLYYQRTYVRVAEQLGISINQSQKKLSPRELEKLRIQILKRLRSKTDQTSLFMNGSLWGWNFGFDFAPSRYRLHASHQQIHQQFALIPSKIPMSISTSQKPKIPEPFKPYSCGDQITDFVEQYRGLTGKDFFNNYIHAIRGNERVDGKQSHEKSLIVFEDQNVIVFVPKAQTSQWELQLMLVKPVGHILDASLSIRKSTDRGILIAVQVLSALGAKLVTSIEYSKRFDSPENNQRLMYSFMPKLPESPGAFSEAQLRWINGHYPEDFATACRRNVPDL